MISTLVRSAVTVATFAPVALLVVVCGLWQSPWVNVGILCVTTVGLVLTLGFFRHAVKTRNPSLTLVGAAKPRLDATVSGLLSLYVIPASIVLLADSMSRWAALAALLFIAAIAVRSKTMWTANPMFGLIGLHPHDVERVDGSTLLVLSDRRRLQVGEVTSLVPIDPGIYVDIGWRPPKPRA
ncbi:MAG: hypothetical protein ACJA07_001541 [Rhodococcus sp. (in: high G+C Gram-positive bacteria)]